MGLMDVLLGVVFVGCVGIGFSLTPGAISAHEFWFVRVIFIVAALSLCAAYLVWVSEGEKSQSVRIAVGVIVGVLSVVGGVESIFWINGRELALNAEKIKPEPIVPTTPVKQLPDLGLRFVYKTSPALVIVNQSDVVARDIKWSVQLWNIDLPSRVNPLPISTNDFNWLRPHSESGPLGLFQDPAVSSLLKPGNRLFGSAMVLCPDCVRGRTYLVSIVVGKGGWFSELTDRTDGALAIPSTFTPAGINKYFVENNASIPANLKTEIQ